MAQTITATTSQPQKIGSSPYHFAIHHSQPALRGLFHAMTDDDFRRLESKVDKLTDAIQRLILIEERQSSQGERIGKCEAAIAVHDTSIHKTDRKVDQWINRGIGVWAAAAVLFTLVQFGSRWVK